MSDQSIKRIAKALYDARVEGDIEARRPDPYYVEVPVGPESEGCRAFAVIPYESLSDADRADWERKAEEAMVLV